MFHLLLSLSMYSYGQVVLSPTDSIPASGQINHEFTYELLRGNRNVVQIINVTDKDINFELSFNKKDWTTFKLRRHQNLVLDDTNFSVYYVQVYTYDKSRGYPLRKGNDYALAFDPKINMYIFQLVDYE